MSTIKSSAENLTLNADGANNDIKFQSNGSEVASIDQAGLVTATTFAGSGASLTALPAANLTGTLPAIDGSALTNLPGGGKVLQVLQVENGTIANTTSSTYQDTSIAVSITPSATTSKILVFATVYTGVSRNDSQKYGATVRLKETTTTNTYPTGTDGNFGNTLITFPSGFLGYIGATISGNWLHSPSSTSALTYKVQFKSWSGTNTTYINTPDGTTNWGDLKSTITVMEIGA